MPDESGATIRELLPDAFSRLADTVRTRLSKSDGSPPSLPGFAWDIAASETSSAIRDALDCDVFALLARGWCFARELSKYKNETEYPPDRKTLVYLGKHALATEVHPVVTLYIGPIECRPLRFTVEVKANFDSAALVIQKAAIIGIAAGECRQCSAEICRSRAARRNQVEARATSGTQEFRSSRLCHRLMERDGGLARHNRSQSAFLGA
jgi:hypothetical protein